MFSAKDREKEREGEKGREREGMYVSVCYMCSSLYVTLTSHVTEYSYVCTLCPINFLVVVQLSSLSHTHTHTRLFLWKLGTSHRCNGFYTVQTVCNSSNLHLNIGHMYIHSSVYGHFSFVYFSFITIVLNNYLFSSLLVFFYYLNCTLSALCLYFL